MSIMKDYSIAEIREVFLKYFERNQHKILPSSSLVPLDDPTLLFTNAGMVQFKDIFLGKESTSHCRATTVQRCMRASGKHNDLENVGYTTRHHTFFEMLGNFSFGDYFKKEAIHYAWEFLTKELEIDPQRLWVTVHNDDHEAAELWQAEFKNSGAMAQGLSRLGDQDNFWAMGETGPCGYCSEIYYDHGSDILGGSPGSSDQDAGERYVEIWNLVFMQFSRDKQGNLTSLPKPSVDTGMGIERLAAVLQKLAHGDNYETDIFREIYRVFDLEYKALSNANKKIDLNSKETKIAMRVIADHIRAATFLIADGVYPSNEGRGYVLRSIIRRAVYHLYKLGVDKPLFYLFVYPVVVAMQSAYPELELEKRQDLIANDIIKNEEEKFLETLERGLKILDQELNKLTDKCIPGIVVFNLHDTYGFPAILTAEIAKKRGLTIDQVGFDVAMEKQRSQSRAASKFSAASELKLAVTGATNFVGYTENSCAAEVLYLFRNDGSAVSELQTGERGIVILDKTPFYAESGGQVGDTGQLVFNNEIFFEVKDTVKYGDHHLHYGVVDRGVLIKNKTLRAEINTVRRQAIKLNHSTTHLLHRALHLVLGEHAVQRGSLVNAKQLRFDFAHFNQLTHQEITEIERIVNAKIRENLSVTTVIKTLASAKEEGVMALFGEKYTDNVRVVTMGDFSKELCGGTHINQTGEVGLFKIITETSIAAGIRRIEAVTGENAIVWLHTNEAELNLCTELLNTSREQLSQQLRQLLDEKNLLGKELNKLKDAAAIDAGKNLAAKAITINAVKILVERLDNISSKNLRQTVDVLKSALVPAVILLAGVTEGKVQLIVSVTKELSAKVNAVTLAQFVAAKLDGKAGGRADLAQGGGANITNFDAALNSAISWIKNILQPSIKT